MLHSLRLCHRVFNRVPSSCRLFLTISFNRRINVLRVFEIWREKNHFVNENLGITSSRMSRRNTTEDNKGCLFTERVDPDGSRTENRQYEAQCFFHFTVYSFSLPVLDWFISDWVLFTNYTLFNENDLTYHLGLSRYKFRFKTE